MAARRLFCALMLGPELGERLARAAAAALAPAASALKLARAADLHLTLYFAGALEPGPAAALEAALAETLAGARAPRLWIPGPGAFGPRGRERVLFARVEPAAGEPPGVLEELARRAALAALAAPAALGAGPPGTPGPPGAERPFSPHVTLARARSRARSGQRPEPRARVPEDFYALKFGLEWQPSRVAWVESPGGGLGYRVLAEFPLEPGPGASAAPKSGPGPWIPSPNP